MRRCIQIIFALIVFWTATPAAASAVALRLGPPSIGSGGPNPITFSPIEMQLQYVSKGLWESNLSITGLLIGKRHKLPARMYVSLGGGLVVSGNGGGLGIYSGFGGDLICGKSVCFTMEYQQALGFGEHLVSPSALRMGVSVWF